jgi:hypothetical protein
MMRGDQRDEVMKRDEGELYCVCVEAAHTGNDIICLSRIAVKSSSLLRLCHQRGVERRKKKCIGRR